MTDLSPDFNEVIADLWPNYRLTREQRDMNHSIQHNKRTLVPAANKMGKDFDSALAVLVSFLTRKPCRVVTTSTKEKHLKVLWGEMNRHISNCKYSLDYRRGGPLKVNYLEIKRWLPKEKRVDPISYIVGLVVSPDTIESMQGHHATPDIDMSAFDTALQEGDDTGGDVGEITDEGLQARFGEHGFTQADLLDLSKWHTLFVGDEASSLDERVIQMADTWAERMLLFGNCWPCENSFKWGVEGKPGTDDRGGDIPDPRGGYLRKVIHIPAETSPNVQYAMKQIAAGWRMSDKGFAPMIVPGVIDYWTYKERLDNLDEDELTVRIRARWYKGAGLFLFPQSRLQVAQDLAEGMRLKVRRARSLGMDSAQGGDKSSWVVGDDLGVLEVVSMKTPDTNVIPHLTVEIGKRWKVPPSMWWFDIGGGGKQHVDRLRAMGYPARGVPFGGSPTPRPTSAEKTPGDRLEEYEDRYSYVKKRDEMYGEASLLFDVTWPRKTQGHGMASGYAIPREYQELIRQLSLMPKRWDDEGRLKMPPKDKPSPEYKGEVLRSIIGCSPDDADAFVLMAHGLLHGRETIAGATAQVNHGFQDYAAQGTFRGRMS